MQDLRRINGSSGPFLERGAAASRQDQEAGLMNAITGVQNARRDFAGRLPTVAARVRGDRTAAASQAADLYGGVQGMSPLQEGFMRQTSSARFGAGGAGGRSILDRFGPSSPLMGLGSTASVASSSSPYMQVGGYGSPLTPINVTPAAQQQQRMQALAGLTQWGIAEGTIDNPRLNFGVPAVISQDGELAYTSRANALQRADQSERALALDQQLAVRRDAVADRRAAMDLPVGPVERRAARDAERQSTMATRQARQLAGMGVSPLSATGQGLAPELYDRIQSQRIATRQAMADATSSLAGNQSIKSPLSVRVPTPEGGTVPARLTDAGSPVTVESIDTARQGIQAVLATSPMFSQLGVSPTDEGAVPEPMDVVGGFEEYMRNNPGVEISQGDLLSLHQVAVQYANLAKARGEENAFPPRAADREGDVTAGLMWNELGQVPLSNSHARQEWWSRYMDKRQQMGEQWGSKVPYLLRSAFWPSGR